MWIRSCDGEMLVKVDSVYIEEDIALYGTCTSGKICVLGVCKSYTEALHVLEDIMRHIETGSMIYDLKVEE